MNNDNKQQTNQIKKPTYRYILTLDRPMFPRKIADELSFAPGIFDHLEWITDCQNDKHIYGRHYRIIKEVRK